MVKSNVTGISARKPTHFSRGSMSAAGVDLNDALGGILKK